MIDIEQASMDAAWLTIEKRQIDHDYHEWVIDDQAVVIVPGSKYIPEPIGNGHIDMSHSDSQYYRIYLKNGLIDRITQLSENIEKDVDKLAIHPTWFEIFGITRITTVSDIEAGAWNDPVITLNEYKAIKDKV